MTPRVSLIVPNWNGSRHLPTCFESLRAQRFRDFETVLVDNASTDGSVALVRSRFPEVRIIRLETNTVFCGAVNTGIRQTTTELVALLNNDTEADPDWLAELVSNADEHPDVGWFASKLLLFDRRDTLHSAGDEFGLDGVPANRGVWEQDFGQYDDVVDVFGACGGAVLYRRSLLDDIGLFDEEFLGYCEDVDLNFRARLRGHRCRFVPRARVYHHLSATGGGPQASYLCGRNFLFVLVKDLPTAIWRRHWWRIARAQAAIATHALRHLRQPAARARVRGQLAALTHLPRLLRARREIQEQRMIDDDRLEALLLAPSPPPWRQRRPHAPTSVGLDRRHLWWPLD
ncbi:MAG: glycosyltransferase family 2 protein [Chloroflexi bacterium]|nr:glycosyltransferase family 2 protein [Chloroflexota bacterium]